MARVVIIRGTLPTECVTDLRCLLTPLPRLLAGPCQGAFLAELPAFLRLVFQAIFFGGESHGSESFTPRRNLWVERELLLFFVDDCFKRPSRSCIRPARLVKRIKDALRGGRLLALEGTDILRSLRPLWSGRAFSPFGLGSATPAANADHGRTEASRGIGVNIRAKATPASGSQSLLPDDLLRLLGGESRPEEIFWARYAAAFELAALPSVQSVRIHIYCTVDPV
eukprot:scaffold48_cov311-Pinguiococcus_pyrenoidosus.AAC.243